MHGDGMVRSPLLGAGCFEGCPDNDVSHPPVAGYVPSWESLGFLFFVCWSCVVLVVPGACTWISVFCHVCVD